MNKNNALTALAGSPSLLAAYLWLALITVIALIAYGEPLHPVDPRTNTWVEGVSLSFPVWGSLFEPFTAPLHIVAFLPDYRNGMVSVFVWLFGFTLLFSLINRKKSAGLLILRNMLMLALIAVLYGVCALTTHFPNWSLSKDAHTMITADLHSHSLLSHDGAIDANNNLKLHKQRGFDLVAFTDHVNPQGPITAFLTTGDSRIVDPAVLAGVEIPVYYGAHYYFLVLGMSEKRPLPKGLALHNGHELPRTPPSVYVRKPFTWSIERFIKTVHQQHGVIITVGYQIEADDVRALAEAGVDAFEFVNYGHRPLTDEVRQAMLDAQRTKRVALLASNDWHGWTGALNAYTLVARSPEEKNSAAREVLLNALRHHAIDRITPVVAQPVHTMGWFETVVAPFTAAFLYARALSPWQLLSWWGWIVVFTLLAKLNGFRNRSMARMTAPALILATGLWKFGDGIGMLYFSDLSVPVSKSYAGAAYVSIGAGMMMVLIALFLAYKWIFQRPKPRINDACVLASERP